MSTEASTTEPDRHEVGGRSDERNDPTDPPTQEGPVVVPNHLVLEALNSLETRGALGGGASRRGPNAIGASTTAPTVPPTPAEAFPEPTPTGPSRPRPASGPLAALRAPRVADRIGALGGLLRIAVVSVTSVLVLTSAEGRTATQLVLLAMVIAITTWRVANPDPDPASRRGHLELVLETLTVAAIIIATGGFDSPFILLAVGPIAVGGLTMGPAVSGPIIGIVVALNLIADLYNSEYSELVSIYRAATWVAVFGFITLLTSMLRYLAAETQRSETDHLMRLESANGLLADLHSLAQDLPSSLDLGEVLDATAGRVRTLVDVDTLAILLHEGADQQLTTALAAGMELPPTVEPTGLPRPIKRALDEGEPVAVGYLPGALNPRSKSLLALPLISRGVIIGVIVLEDAKADRYGPHQLELIADLVRSAAVEIDNARWFKLLRTVGADEERNRIARDLHDRIGQALAYLGFELDRVLAQSSKEDADPLELSDDLRRLRNRQREVVQEVRNALYDLRTEASDEEAPAAVLARFAERVAKRSGLTFHLDLDADLRLPARQERELWRIAQEAMTNVERHARATSVTISWARLDGSAELRVLDDGQGFTPGQSGRMDSYGLLGMRERASAIGATLSIERGSGQGTLVRCSLPVASPGRARGTTSPGGKAL